MASAPGLSCTVLQLPYAKPAAGAQAASSIISCHQVIRPLLLPAGNTGRLFHGMKPGQPRFALKPLAVQQSAWMPDSSPGRNNRLCCPGRLCHTAAPPERNFPSEKLSAFEDSLQRMQQCRMPMNGKSYRKRLRTACVRSLLGFSSSCFPTRSCVLSALSRLQGLSAFPPEPSPYR